MISLSLELNHLGLKLKIKKKSDFIILLSNMHIEIMDHLKRFFFLKHLQSIEWRQLVSPSGKK